MARSRAETPPLIRPIILVPKGEADVRPAREREEAAAVAEAETVAVGAAAETGEALPGSGLGRPGVQATLRRADVGGEKTGEGRIMN